jgi:hypothetical protein
MSKLQKLTLLILVSDLLILVAYDIYAAYQGGAPATISWMISWSGQQWWGSTLVLAIGYLLGHFFAQDNKIPLSDEGKKPI